MIKTITSRDEFESLLKRETTMLIYGGKKCAACKRQIEIINEMGLTIPVYYTDIESPGMINYIRIVGKNGLPIIAIFKDKIVKRTWQKGLAKPNQIMALMGGLE